MVTCKLEQNKNNNKLWSLVPISLLGSSSNQNIVVSASVGPEGGTLRSPDNTFSLEILAGALNETRLITITQNAKPIGSVPEGYTRSTPIFKFEPSGLNFVKPAIFKVNYEQGEMLESSFEERTGAMYYIKDDSTLERMKVNTRDFTANLYVYAVPHFSFAVGLTVRISNVISGTTSNLNPVLNVVNAVLAELGNPPTGMTTYEYFQANSNLLIPFMEIADQILGYNPFLLAFPELAILINGLPILKTGQTSCYNESHSAVICSGTYDGQDARENKGLPRSYTDNGNGTIKDNSTNLVWQKCLYGQNNDSGCSGIGEQAYTITEATNYCQSLTLAARKWRLPTASELESLIDYGKKNPAIDTTFFPNIYGTRYGNNTFWTNTQYACSNCYYQVDFYFGDVSFNGTGAYSTVRCVSNP